ncbi:MAG: hypothetical protein AB8H79_22210 [Myxococcota bacterium]
MRSSAVALCACIAPVLLLGAACRSETGFTPFGGFKLLDTDHGQWLSMSVAPDGSPSMAFYDRTNGGLGFAIGSVRSEGVLWAYEEPDGYPNDGGLDGGDVGTYTDHIWSPDGTAWVSYHTPGQGTLKVAHRVGRTWTSEVVDTGSGLRPKTGVWTSIALDADNNPVVVYHDENSGVLRMARKSGDAWTTETIFEGTAYTGTDADGNEVTRDADVGEYAQILIDGNTHYISFYDRANQDLVLLEGFLGAYVSTVIASEGDQGAWPSMHLEGTQLAISYHDVGQQDLKLAVREGGGTFEVQTVDDEAYRGADSALFKRDGKWGMAYFDGAENDVRVATEGEPSVWTHAKLAGDSRAVGFHNEVVQDGQGRWWAGSYDYTDRKPYIRQIE